MERVGPTGQPRGRSYAFCTTVVEAHENVGHCRFNRARELLRAVGLVQRGGEREHRNAGYAFIGELNVGARLTESSSVALDVAAAQAIAEVQARTKSEETGLV